MLTLNGNKIINIGSDQPINVTGLINSLTGGYVNDSSVWASLEEMDGQPIQAIELVYVPDSDGVYVGIIPKIVTSQLDDCAQYRLSITTIGDNEETDVLIVIAKESRVS
jgi:hypothetical protein